MIFGNSFFALVVLALWIYCIFDVISTDRSRVQNLPKLVWLLIVVLIPLIGPVSWLLLGRPRGASFRVASGERTTRSTPPPPETSVPDKPAPDPDYQRRREEAIRKHQEERDAELKAREAELRRLEEELRRREQGVDEAGT